MPRRKTSGGFGPTCSRIRLLRVGVTFGEISPKLNMLVNILRNVGFLCMRLVIQSYENIVYGCVLKFWCSNVKFLWSAALNFYSELMFSKDWNKSIFYNISIVKQITDNTSWYKKNYCKINSWLWWVEEKT